MDGWITIGTKLETKNFDKEIKALEREIKETEREIKDGGMTSVETTDAEAKVERLKNRLIDLQKQQEKINQQELSGFTNSIQSVEKGLESSIKKVGKLVLGIFSVRSSYMFVRQAVSTLSGENKQLGNDITNIRSALANTMLPVIQTIVSWVKTLMAYANYLWRAFFGKDLFKAGAKNLASGAKSASKIRKELQLTDFDEIRKLDEKSTTSGGGGGTGVDEFNQGLANVPIPDWIKWIAEHGNVVKGIIIGIGTAIATLKLASFISNLIGVGNALNFIKGTAIAITLAGIVTTIINIIKFIKDPSWENFKGILVGLTITLGGLSLAMIAFNATNPIGWIGLAITAVAGLVTGISEMIGKNKANKASLESVEDAQNRLTEAINRTAEASNIYVNAVDRAEEAENRLKEAEKKHHLSGEELYKQVLNGTLAYEDMNSAQKEVYKAYLNNITAQNNLKNATQDFNNATDEEKMKMTELEIVTSAHEKNYDKLREAMTNAWQKGTALTGEAREAILASLDQMDEETRDTFLKSIPDNVLKGLDPVLYSGAMAKFKNSWSNFLTGLPKNLSLNITSSLSPGLKQKLGFAKGGIVYPKLKYLASGGIVNQPNRGVPVSRAIAGEAGAEGIIPLTDAQQMETLGEAIGKYITINNYITNKMNSRTISRELQIVQGQQDFAYNT